jgi:hypothetical protein
MGTSSPQKLFMASLAVFYMSRPLLRLMYGEYWFCLSHLSMMVIGSFASYPKTKSVESAVWCLLTLDDDVETGSRYNGYFFCFTGTSSVLLVLLLFYGIKIPEQSSGSELLFFFWTTINKTQMKMKQMNNRTTNKINERIITDK